MIKKFTSAFATIVALMAAAVLAGSPASASVPDWDKVITWEQAGFSAEVAADLKAQGYAVHTPAEWAEAQRSV